jgi:hypothetical protein
MMEQQEHQGSNGTIQGEGVLRDILDELDRERSRRAELEVEVRKLKDKQEHYRYALAASVHEQEGKKEVPVSKRELIATETERDGFKQLIDALTADNDAVSVAMQSRERTLSLHVVRMLEIMPYDPRAVQSAKAEEEVGCHVPCVSVCSIFNVDRISHCCMKDRIIKHAHTVIIIATYAYA